MAKEKLKIKGTKIDFTKKMSIEELRDNTNMAYGKGTASSLSVESGRVMNVMPTGHMYLDWALGGGIGKGRIVEVLGPESSGKTTLALHLIALAQRLGGIGVFIDAEHALEPAWAETMGVNLDELIFAQPNYGEQALELVRDFSKNPGVSIIVIDSTAALVPKSELEGQVGDAQMGIQARMMSQVCRQLTSEIHDECIVVFISQIRSKIGVMFGSNETVTGGNALKFYSSQRIDTRRRTISEEEDIPIKNEAQIKVIKNKIAPPHRKVPENAFTIDYNSGLEFSTGLAYFCKRFIREGEGTWFDIAGHKLQGIPKLVEAIREDPKIRKDIVAEICDRVPLLHKEFYIKHFDDLIEMEKRTKEEVLSRALVKEETISDKDKLSNKRKKMIPQDKIKNE